MSDQLETIKEEIAVWERVAHPNIIKIFELYDDIEKPEMYLLMERAQYGQIQGASGAKPGELVCRKKEIYDIAIKKGKTIWPDQSGCSDVENAAKWIFF